MQKAIRASNPPELGTKPNPRILIMSKSNNFELEAEELAKKETELAQQRAELLQRKWEAEQALRAERTDEYNALVEDEKEWRELIKTTTDPNQAKEYLEAAKNARRQADKIANELGLFQVAPQQDEEESLVSRVKGLSTNKAIWFLVACFIISCIVTFQIGQNAIDDPLNPMGQSIIKNAPLRVMVAFTLTFLTVLVAIFFKWLLFNPFFRLWHNRINTDRNLDSLIGEAPAWSLLASLLALFYILTSLFATYYTTLFA